MGCRMEVKNPLKALQRSYCGGFVTNSRTIALNRVLMMTAPYYIVDWCR